VIKTQFILSCGNLKIKDINLEELTVHIKGAKGNKDRITIFPEKLKNE